MTSEQLEQIWSDVQRSLSRLVPENVYRIWLEQLRPVALDESALYLEAPDQMLDWLRRRFGTTLDSAARAVDPVLRRVELLGAGAAGKQPQSPVIGDAPALQNAPVASDRRLNPSNSFSEFVIGANNRFAHAAALAVAELPAHAYNPVFFHGQPGTGKTHLLQAIANYVSAHEPHMSVRYLTAETFSTSFRNSLRNGTIDEFKRAHRSADVLLVDDVHFFDQKKRSTEELLFTVEDLVGSGSQVVLSAELPPTAMPFLGPRLQDRLGGGLVAAVEPPDFATRIAVLRRRAPQLQSDQELELLEYLARTVTSNVRALEGALIRVHAYASLTQQPLTYELAQHVVAHLQPSDADSSQLRQSPSIEHIQKHIAGQLGVTEDDLASPKRNRQVVYARQVAMYLCREMTPLSLPSISSRFGGRDHTTVLHAHRKIKQRLLTDPDTRALIDRAQRELDDAHPTH